MTCTRCGGLFREGAGAWGGGRTVLDEADGCVLWGGYQQQWDANAWWLPRFLDRIGTRTDVDYVVRVVKAKRAFLI